MQNERQIVYDLMQLSKPADAPTMLKQLQSITESITSINNKVSNILNNLALTFRAKINGDKASSVQQLQKSTK
ncbi:MAG: hypothetical protein HC908_11815 [Calothrix sp. SM1_7_51]|nr:hypothetical protein [Calothrix sp. SM1_7_51]